jgi:Zn finger protein HypA/HybF involved in hydrogenase expression
MSFTFICLQCGKEWKCTEEQEDEICDFCKLENLETMTGEEMEDFLKKR